MRKTICLLLMICLALSCAAGEEKVFTPGTTEPFEEDAVLLTVYVGTLLGGDCMLMTLGGQSMFVDLGTDMNIDQINAVIEAAGIDQADFFNSHPHRDHAGGLIPLIEEGFPVGTMYTFFPHDYTGAAVIQKKVIRYAETAGIQIVDLKTGDQIPFGDAELTAYRIPDDTITAEMDCNNMSAMLMVRYGNCSVLLSADVENFAQKKLAELYDLKADILKYPHHGLAPMEPVFLEEVDPEYVVITHGSHDTDLAQEQLEATGYHRITFATWGIIVMQTDGRKWIVHQEILPEVKEYTERYLQKHDWIQP